MDLPDLYAVQPLDSILASVGRSNYLVLTVKISLCHFFSATSEPGHYLGLHSRLSWDTFLEMTNIFLENKYNIIIIINRKIRQNQN
jgi:hypothetical protein